MKKIALAVLGLVFCFNVLAQDRNDAVVYIQSDKETPIYVKMEGQMMERFSKNYVIMNGLASGPLHLEVLFQQSQYPAQKFILNVAPSAQRSLILQKVSDKKFALYDLNYGIYLQEGNKVEDDIDLSNIPAVAANNNSTISQSTKEQENTIPTFKAEEKKEADRLAKETAKRNAKEEKKKKEAEETIPSFETTKNETNEEPKLSRAERKRIEAAEKEKQAEQERFLNFEIDKKEQEIKTENRRKANTASAHSASCTEPASESEFNSFASVVNASDDEELKLSAVKKNGSKYCFSTDQVRLIAMGFESQSSRYEVARSLKSYVVDKDKYGNLSVLFNTNYLKDRFKKEVLDK